MKVLPIPALSDNYMYLLIDRETDDAAIVDPVNLKSINKAVEEAGVKLTSCLVTHHHWDHAGATKELADAYSSLSIYGGDDRILGVTNKVRDGDVFKIGELDVKCLYTPCHTAGSICYYVTDGSGDKVVFTGDTLFIGGNKKMRTFFEGNAIDMDFALNEKLANLPNDTKIYCGHEYTVDNLKFAHSVEPKNDEIKKKLAWAEERRKTGDCTVPSTIEEEKRFNPFMRVRTAGYQVIFASATDDHYLQMASDRSAHSPHFRFNPEPRRLRVLLLNFKLHCIPFVALDQIRQPKFLES
ncbi:Hydroxyacylglutathione hydrolase, mitochondrial [Dirofilaria immitis]|nr:Hydroxyacylglutathione hydrolase, mitochondrial [Dirofilaria immitis]